jgi:polyferredoxin
MPRVELVASDFQRLADLVLVLHFGVVAFVVGGLVLVWVGNGLDLRRLRRCVNGLAFRVAHLLAIAIVVAESWLGIVCPLTSFEQALRSRAGVPAPGGEEAFLASWLSRLLFYDAPVWVFTLAYSLFGLLVVASWWSFPPRRAGGEAPAPGPRQERERPRE